MLLRKHVGTRMGLLQQRCTGSLLCVLSLLEAAGTVALMSYALLYEVGNLVDLPEKRTGFYNFCLWNETVGELQCLDYEHLQMMGIGLPMMLSTVCVYSCLVLSLFYFLYLVAVKCTEQREEWNMVLIFHIIQTVILSGGLVTFLLQTSQWIQPSDFTGGFLALLGTLALLLLQIITSTMHLSWAKYQNPLTEKGLAEERRIELREGFWNCRQILRPTGRCWISSVRKTNKLAKTKEDKKVLGQPAHEKNVVEISLLMEE